MVLQQRIAREIAQDRVGRKLKLLLDQPLIARTEADAPEVDARVILSEPGQVGAFIWRTVRGVRGYDLLA
jgi:ribosomal protein S12 methylthiotransferase